MAKKLKKKWENTILSFLQVKIGYESPWKRENKKKIVPMCSYPTRNRKFQKKSKKIQKIWKYHHRFISSQNRFGKAKKERKLKKSFRCVPSRPVIEYDKKIAKKFEKLVNTIIASFQGRIGWKMQRKREKKIKNRSDVFLADP